MSRPSVLILVSILTLLTPFSGIPRSIQTFLFVAYGLIFLGIGLIERSTAQRKAVAPHEPAAPQHAPTEPPQHEISPI